ncbi:MAG: gamma-glutamyltransferase family protein [Pseudomonadota bacterium]
MQFPPANPYPSRRSAVMADNVVATSHPLAAEAGLSMIRRGGNAADAALATAITLTLVEPTGNGIGSDAFAIIWDGSALHGLNASGHSPAGWTPERFPGAEMPERGWDSVTVPGCVGAWVAVSERFGKLPFEALFEPAIRLAEQGFIVSPVIGSLWARGAAVLEGQPGYAEHFMPGGRVPVAGERFASPEVAATLTAIAETKGEAFYRGAIAEKIAAASAANGGALTADDLAAEAPDWCGTISGGFDGVTLHEIPPNGQGIAACMALGMLEHTAVRDAGPDDPRSVHLMIEAVKLALRDVEAHVGDPTAMAFGPDALLDPGYLAERARLIDPERAQDFGAGAPKAGGTVYLSAADASGMMVSFIQSNYAGFGSGCVVPGTGISLQNRGAGFVTTPGHPNRVGPRKRPFHTIIPGFLMKDGAPLMSFGVMGGPIQAQGHVQMVLRTQLWGQDVQAAVDAPRWRVTQGLGLAVETAMDPTLREALAAMGHVLDMEPPDAAFGFGGAQLVHRLPAGGYAAGSDPRKDGAAVGF